MNDFVSTLIIFSYLFGIFIGWSILKIFLIINPLDELYSNITNSKDIKLSKNMENIHKHFINLVWRSYGIFIAALTLIGAWFAGKLAFEPKILEFIAPKSFICAILLVIVISISLNMIWAAYISISLMVINKIIAHYDNLYMNFLSHPLRVAYNSIFVLVIDIIFFLICLSIIVYYKELGHFDETIDIYWNIYYYFTIIIFGAGSYLRLKARFYVFNELISE
jgi:hypothetical protein